MSGMRIAPFAAAHEARRFAIDNADHAEHWTINPFTGERVDEASFTEGDQRIYLCGHTEPA